MEIVAGSMVGGTVVIFNGPRENINKAIDYYKSKDIRVEVIQDAGA